MTLVVTRILPEALQLERRASLSARETARLKFRETRGRLLPPASHRADHSFDDSQGPIVPFREESEPLVDVDLAVRGEQQVGSGLIRSAESEPTLRRLRSLFFER